MNFKIGSVVIGQHFIDATRLNGMEGTLLEFVSPNDRIFHIRHQRYEPMYEAGASIEWADGYRCVVEFKNLRLKKPPQETTDWAAQQVQKLLNNIPQKETV